MNRDTEQGFREAVVQDLKKFRESLLVALVLSTTANIIVLLFIVGKYIWIVHYKFY